MAEAIDFSTRRKPTLPIFLRDAAGERRVRVTTPTLDLMQEIRGNLPALQALLEGVSDESREAVFDLAARLISCNRDGLTVTGQELIDKYDLDEEDLTVFFSEYLDFIEGLAGAKNLRSRTTQTGAVRANTGTR